MSPTPYYSDDTVTLYHGDSLEILPYIEPGTVHHVVTDPPYILQAGSSSQAGSKTGGWADMMNASYWYTVWYRECGRLLRGDGSLWTFGNWRTLPAMQRAAIDSGMPATSLLVWDKAWIGPAGPQALRSQHEFCLVMSKPAFKIPDRSQGDVLRFPVGPNKPTGHPAEKPVGLLRRICELTGSKPGAMILDPFTGSGTTLVAARELGFKAIGIEAEERWCEVAAQRLAQPTLDLFDSTEEDEGPSSIQQAIDDIGEALDSPR